MGRVYEVTSVRDGRRLALKVVGSAPTEEALSRFTREAELAARVVPPDRHVSIVDFDVGDDGLPFLVMDFVAGVPLEGHRHRFGDVPWALGLLAQIAEGLEAIHARGIVHRDLKPANVLLSESETVARITDFGISCAAPSPDDELTAPATMPGDPGAMLTKTGLVLGTPAYMAPELAYGARDATPAVDAFGFAVMAYELLAGRRPFAEPAILAAQRGERALPVAYLGDLVPAVPAALADLIDDALRSDPPRRPSAHDFARAFSDVLAGSPALREELAMTFEDSTCKKHHEEPSPLALLIVGDSDRPEHRAPGAGRRGDRSCTRVRHPDRRSGSVSLASTPASTWRRSAWKTWGARTAPAHRRAARGGVERLSSSAPATCAHAWGR